jgi:hypothetical protein
MAGGPQLDPVPHICRQLADVGTTIPCIDVSSSHSGIEWETGTMLQTAPPWPGALHLPKSADVGTMHSSKPNSLH